MSGLTAGPSMEQRVFQEQQRKQLQLDLAAQVAEKKAREEARRREEAERDRREDERIRNAYRMEQMQLNRTPMQQNPGVGGVPASVPVARAAQEFMSIPEEEEMLDHPIYEVGGRAPGRLGRTNHSESDGAQSEKMTAISFGGAMSVAGSRGSPGTPMMMRGARGAMISPGHAMADYYTYTKNATILLYNYTAILIR